MKPIVKWAGGKSRLLAELTARVPREMGAYAEPFAGGAALFFALAADVARGERTMRRAILADDNPELVACYRAVRDDVEAVITALGAYRYDRDLFYETREKDPTGMPDVERAARFLFLNKTCFNGLWRVNSAGRFNVPFGSYKNPRIMDPPGLRAASAALRKVKLVHGDFTQATARLGEGDFVYFDPPYSPASTTADFTSYAAKGFGPADHARLVAEVCALAARGAKVMLSNADTPETRALYKGLRVRVIRAPRSINADGAGRADTTEVLVTTWERPGLYGARAARAAVDKVSARR